MKSKHFKRNIRFKADLDLICDLGMYSKLVLETFSYVTTCKRHSNYVPVR